MTDDDKGFVVTDRRGLDAQGATLDDGQGSAAGEGASGAATGSQGADDAARASGRPLPEIDFATFLLSLGSSALYHLGELPHPEKGQPETSLPLARQTIDILGILAEKTRGNLTADEQQLLDSLLYDLRMKFVAKSRG
jgi:hypothetical protein